MKRIDDRDTTQALKLLMQDHRRVRRLFRHAEDAAADPLAQARAADLACRELEAHSEIEARWLYPLLRRAGADEATERASFDHDVARRLIAALDRLGPADAGYDGTLRELADWVDEHVREEETVLLARAKEAELDLGALADALLDRQRHGALTDVDVDAETADDAGVSTRLEPGDSGAHDRQRSRPPRRSGAH
jgi:hypothetical protein